jgi:hypothetical protein
MFFPACLHKEGISSYLALWFLEVTFSHLFCLLVSQNVFLFLFFLSLFLSEPELLTTRATCEGCPVNKTLHRELGAEQQNLPESMDRS